MSKEVKNRQVDFTPYERNSIYVEIIMQESPKIESVFDLYSFLHQEKERIYKIIVKGDSLDRMVLAPELIEINQELSQIEEYFTLLSKKQDN